MIKAINKRKKKTVKLLIIIFVVLTNVTCKILCANMNIVCVTIFI